MEAGGAGGGLQTREENTGFGTKDRKAQKHVGVLKMVWLSHMFVEKIRKWTEGFTGCLCVNAFSPRNDS